MQRYYRTVLCLLALVTSMSLSAEIRGVLRTRDGPISGLMTADRAVVAFKGIPYATPPVGKLRWTAPKPPASWSKVLKATHFSDSCIQNIVSERKPWTSEFMAHNASSEDCLYLNVWTPARTGGAQLPVFFWIHGGGYVEGSSAVPVYDGEMLARQGVVVVTINYRLGVFGYLAHPELTREAQRSGNYGSLDQLAALLWVHDNIAAFGGDPNNVTIAGQSAGASSVHNLVASPLARGLFQRAIAESGSGISAPGGSKTLSEAESDGVRFATAKGASSLEELRHKSSEELMAKVGDGPASAFRPVIDGYFLEADANAVYAMGKQNDVPELTGMNLDERSSAADYGNVPMAKFHEAMTTRFADLSARFFQLYPDGTPSDSNASQLAASREAGLASMWLWGRLRASTARTPAFTYYWTHAEPGPDSARYGAFHTSEVPYVFDTLDQSMRPWIAEDRKLAALIGGYWVNFMKQGDPNGANLPHWPAFSANALVTMELGDAVGPRHLPEAATIDFWNSYLNRPGAAPQ